MPGPLSCTDNREGVVGGARLDDHAARVGELDGVADQVEHHLGEPALVAVAPSAVWAASTLSASFLLLASDSTTLNTL